MSEVLQEWLAGEKVHWSETLEAVMRKRNFTYPCCFITQNKVHALTFWVTWALCHKCNIGWGKFNLSVHLTEFVDIFQSVLENIFKNNLEFPCSLNQNPHFL